MTLAKENFALNSTSLTNIIFSFFPFSFILGNFIINLNFFLFCCLGIFHLRSKILTNKLNFPLKIISLFFLLVLFSTSLNFIESLYFGESDKFDLSRLIKSILFLRFFIILLLVFLLSKFEIINYKLFFTLVAILPVLISIDVIFQYIFGFNVIGIKSLPPVHNSSFFGDELIAGGYIQNFSFFSILFLTHLIKKNKNIFKIFLTTLTICTLAIGIILSGNKMPFFLFLFGLFLLFLLHKDSRKIVLISYLFIFIIFELIKYSDRNMLNAYNSFFSNMQTSVVSLSVKVKNDLLSNTQGKEKSEKEEKWKDDLIPMQFLSETVESNAYKKLALTAIEIWKSNKIFGNGIKSFRVKCQKVIIEQKRGLCSNHPHNYYLEILVDLGIAGILLAILYAVAFIIFIAKKYKNLSKNNLQNLFLLAAIISLFLEVFPFKSSGSIFTTNNATYLILMSSIVLSYQNLLKEKNFG